jgi:hypothetical protein
VFDRIVIGGLFALGPLATIAYFTVFDASWFTWIGLGLFWAVIAGVAGRPRPDDSTASAGRDSPG